MASDVLNLLAVLCGEGVDGGEEAGLTLLL